jgi:hypothetical protein
VRTFVLLSTAARLAAPFLVTQALQLQRHYPERRAQLTLAAPPLPGPPVAAEGCAWPLVAPLAGLLLCFVLADALAALRTRWRGLCSGGGGGCCCSWPQGLWGRHLFAADEGCAAGGGLGGGTSGRRAGRTAGSAASPFSDPFVDPCDCEQDSPSLSPPGAGGGGGGGTASSQLVAPSRAPRSSHLAGGGGGYGYGTMGPPSGRGGAPLVRQLQQPAGAGQPLVLQPSGFASFVLWCGGSHASATAEHADSGGGGRSYGNEASASAAAAAAQLRAWSWQAHLLDLPSSCPVQAQVQAAPGAAALTGADEEALRAARAEAMYPIPGCGDGFFGLGAGGRSGRGGCLVGCGCCGSSAKAATGEGRGGGREREGRPGTGFPTEAALRAGAGAPGGGGHGHAEAGRNEGAALFSETDRFEQWWDCNSSTSAERMHGRYSHLLGPPAPVVTSPSKELQNWAHQGPTRI